MTECVIAFTNEAQPKGNLSKFQSWFAGKGLRQEASYEQGLSYPSLKPTNWLDSRVYGKLSAEPKGRKKVYRLVTVVSLR